MKGFSNPYGALQRLFQYRKDKLTPRCDSTTPGTVPGVAHGGDQERQGGEADDESERH